MSHTENWRHQLAADPHSVTIGIWSGLLLLDVVLWSRWLSGGMTIPLTAPLAWASSGLITSVAVTALVLWRETDRPWFPRTVWLPEGITLALPWLWGWAVGFGTSAFTWGGLFALWGMLIIAVGLVHLWLPVLRSVCETASDRAASSDINSPDNGQSTTDWQKRIPLPEGEMIEGGAHVDFVPGQKEAVLHLAFCPPLNSAR